MSWDIFSKSKIQYFLQKLKDKFVQKETGKGLSTNDFDNTYKSKVDKIDVSLSSISGNPISIPNLKSNQLAKDPIITLESIQDLHGQLKPYPDGGGKNKLPLTVDGIKAENTDGTWNGDTYTLNGVTFTLLTDNGNNIIGIKVSGTASTSDGSSLYLVRAYTVAQASIMTGCPADGSTYSYRLSMAGVGSDIGSGRNLSQGETGNIYIYRGNTTVSGTLTFYPMIRLATESDATFAPYSNICPISGYDKIEVLSCGKNIAYNLIARPSGSYNPSVVKGENTYTFSGSGAVFITEQVKAGKTYVLSYTITSGSFLNVRVYDDLDSTTIIVSSVSNGVAFTPSADGYIRFWFTSNVVISNLQLEMASSATTYETPNKTTDISESLGQTVYWGELDVRSGKFKVIGQIIDMGDITWNYITSYTYPLFLGGGFDNDNIDYSSTDTILYCSCYKAINGLNYNSFRSNAHNLEIANITNQGAGSRVALQDTNYTDAALFKTAVTGQKLVYKLATPFTIQLTPHEISLLKDYAYVSTNGTNIALDYHNGELASLSDVSQLGETVNELGSLISKTDFGTRINLATYSQAEPYITPCDGYIVVYSNGNGIALVNIAGTNEVQDTNTNFNFGIFTAQSGVGQGNSIYVKKGMKLSIPTSSPLGTGSTARFYPLNG